MATRGEERVSTFLLTAFAVGFLTESITRFLSLMHKTPSVVLCGILGLLSLLFLLMHMGLTSD